MLDHVVMCASFVNWAVVLKGGCELLFPLCSGGLGGEGWKCAHG